MNKPPRKKGNTGKRYSEATRRKILAFVAKRGRGGISAATRTFGVSYIALRRWMELGPGGAPRGASSGGKGGKGPAGKVGMDGRKARRLKTALATVKALRGELGKLQASLKKLLK
jgi:transposase-like protein